MSTTGTMRYGFNGTCLVTENAMCWPYKSIMYIKSELNLKLTYRRTVLTAESEIKSTISSDRNTCGLVHEVLNRETCKMADLKREIIEGSF